MPNYNKVYDRTRKQYLWWIERDSIGIAEYDPMVEEKNKFTSPDAAYQITLFYYKKADHFNTLDSGSSAMTEQSERGIKEGKTFANRGRISGIGSIKQHSY